MALYIGILSYMSIPMFFTIFSSLVVAGCCWLCQPAVGTRESSIGPPELTPLIWSPSVCHWPWRWFLEKNNKHWDVSTLQYAGKQPYLYKYTRFSCRLKWFNKIVIYMDIYIYKWLNSSKLTKKTSGNCSLFTSNSGSPFEISGTKPSDSLSCHHIWYEKCKAAFAAVACFTCVHGLFFSKWYLPVGSAWENAIKNLWEHCGEDQDME